MAVIARITSTERQCKIFVLKKAQMDVEYVEPTQVRSASQLQLPAARAGAARGPLVPVSSARKRHRYVGGDESVLGFSVATETPHARARTFAHTRSPIVLLSDAELISALEGQGTDPTRIQEVEYLLGMQNDVYRRLTRRVAMGDETAARERVVSEHLVLVPDFPSKRWVLEQLQARGWDINERGKFITPTYVRLQELEALRREAQQRQILDMLERQELERQHELRLRIEQARMERSARERERLAQKTLAEQASARPTGRVLGSERPDLLQRFAEQRAMSEAARAAAIARSRAGRRLDE